VTFTAWYESVIKPQLEETLKSMPVVTREPLRTASRMSMAACWNAALDAVCYAKFTREEYPPAICLPAEIREQILELRA
jgi:hypothetical protein